MLQKSAASTVQAASAINDRQVGGAAGLEGHALHAQDGALVGTHELGHALPGDLAGGDQVGDDQAQAGLQADHAERRQLELASFSHAVCGAWSVTMASTVPSITPAIRASASAAVRNGGLTLRAVE